MKQGYRIISIEAADIYRHEQENGVGVGYKMPESKSDAYFRLFKIYLDNSLDSVELENAYKRVCRKKFSFQDKSENEYTLAVINLKFNYTYKPENGKPIKIKDLRSHFYKNGFYNSISIPKMGGMTTIEILFESILNESDEIFGIAFLRFGIEIELFSSEKLENDTNFS